MAEVKSRSIFSDVIKDQNTEEPSLQEGREACFEYLFQFNEEIEESWIGPDEEKEPLETEIEEFLTCLSQDPTCTQENNQKSWEDWHDMTKEGMPPVTNESKDQEYVNSTENWFQTIVGTQCSSIIKQSEPAPFLASLPALVTPSSPCCAFLEPDTSASASTNFSSSH